MGIGGAILDAMAGDDDKAVLIIHDTGGRSFGQNESPLGKVAGILNNAASHGGLTAASLGAASAIAGFGQSMMMHVQYNPSSLQIMGSAKSMQMMHLQGHMMSDIVNSELVPPAVYCNVELIFDDCNNRDAFMSERFALGDVGSAVSSIAHMALGQHYSVQKETNGLVAALMNSNTRLVTFRWAGMSFSGEINEVSAKYTMFSVSGRPIRSVVKLKIMQQVTDKAGMEYWDKAFDRKFGGAGLGMISGGKKLSQKVGGMLNLG